MSVPDRLIDIRVLDQYQGISARLINISVLDRLIDIGVPDQLIDTSVPDRYRCH